MSWIVRATPSSIWLRDGFSPVLQKKCQLKINKLTMSIIPAGSWLLWIIAINYDWSIIVARLTMLSIDCRHARTHWIVMASESIATDADACARDVCRAWRISRMSRFSSWICMLTSKHSFVILIRSSRANSRRGTKYGGALNFGFVSSVGKDREVNQN